MDLIPLGSDEIMKARKSGFRPKDMIIISMMGKLETEKNPIVQVANGKKYDWSFLKGLQAVFFCTGATYDAKQIINASMAHPSGLYLWNPISGKGYRIWVLPKIESVHLPMERWDWEVSYLRFEKSEEIEFAMGL